MSHTTIYAVRKPEDGFESEAEFRNSHGSATFVWNALLRRYKDGILKGKPLLGDNGNWGRGVSVFDAWSEVWKYDQAGGYLEPWERNVLRSTYDNAVLMRDSFLMMADAMDHFEAAHHSGELAEHACTLHKQAECLRKLHVAGDVVAVAWCQTSVGEFWGEGHRDMEADEDEDGDLPWVPYRIDQDSQHFVIEVQTNG